MQKYFCEHLKKVTEGLKMSYICKKTNKVCPMVKYGYNAEAIPNIYFTTVGCELLKEKNVNKEEKIVEVKKDEITIEQPKQSVEQKETTKKQYNRKKKSKK